MAEVPSQSVERPATTSPGPSALPRGRTAALLGKHAFDRVVALCGLIVTAPLLAVVALGLRRASGRVLRRDHRLVETGDAIVVHSLAISDDLCRRSRVWHLVASAGIGALPQLWSVLRGELSIIGPHPREIGFVRPLMRPGLTGLSQLEQLRRRLSVTEQLELDDEYARNWSLWLDAQIVWRTLWVALR
jgi:lipopolysaccharide/colanic/teichoic acid biosynthesis glycosyltransferase